MTPTLTFEEHEIDRRATRLRTITARSATLFDCISSVQQFASVSRGGDRCIIGCNEIYDGSRVRTPRLQEQQHRQIVTSPTLARGRISLVKCTTSPLWYLIEGNFMFIFCYSKGDCNDWYVGRRSRGNDESNFCYSAYSTHSRPVFSGAILRQRRRLCG